MEYTLYTKTHCPQCMMTKRLLKTKGIEYGEINVTENPEEITKLKELGFQKLPILMADGMKPIVGFDVPRLQELA